MSFLSLESTAKMISGLTQFPTFPENLPSFGNEIVLQLTY